MCLINFPLLFSSWIIYLIYINVKVKVAQSCPTLCDPMDYTVHAILQARILEWVAFPFSRGSFQPRDQNPGLPHCRQILYQLSHKGSPRILEWAAYPFSRGSSRPRNHVYVNSKLLISPTSIFRLGALQGATGTSGSLHPAPSAPGHSTLGTQANLASGTPALVTVA